MNAGRCTKLAVFMVSSLAAVLLGGAPALAQYWIETPDGFELVPVTETNRLSLAADDALVEAAGAAAGITLEGLFRPDAAARRFYEIGWMESEDGSGGHLAEYELVPTNEVADLDVEPVDYHFEGGEVLIGFGPDPVDEWGPYLIISFLVDSAGDVEELARHECGAQYCYGVYALDLIGDGVSELVVPWTTGFGGNGGVELFAIVPTGGFSGWGEYLASGSFWSSHGATTLLDYDGDGDWELTSYVPLVYSAAGYMFTELLTFDRERNEWIDAAAIAPELYEQQYDFYERLLAALEDFANDPAPYRVEGAAGWGVYACEIDGESRCLDPFIVPEEGTLDEYWLGELKNHVATWRGEPEL